MLFVYQLNISQLYSKIKHFIPSVLSQVWERRGTLYPVKTYSVYGELNWCITLNFFRAFWNNKHFKEPTIN